MVMGARIRALGLSMAHLRVAHHHLRQVFHCGARLFHVAEQWQGESRRGAKGPEGGPRTGPGAWRGPSEVWPPNTAPPAFAVADQGVVAHAVEQGQHGVLHHYDKGAAPYRGPVDESGPQAQILRQRRGLGTGREDAVDILPLEPCVPRRVEGRLGVKLKDRLVGQRAVLIGFVGAYNSHPASEL